MASEKFTSFDGCGADAQSSTATPVAALPAYLALGVAFGYVLTRSEVLSWFRIQEMFRFQSFRMYGIIAAAIATAALSLRALRAFKIRALGGEAINPQRRNFGRGFRYAIGGTLFGLGWALTGACPGPLFALIGNGVTVMLAAVVSALAGTWLYGFLSAKLPE